MKKKKIIGIGEFLFDLLPSGKKAGGAPVNLVYHASKHGADACAISAVGNDNLGRELIREAEVNGIEIIAPVVAYPTGTVDVKLDTAGSPTFIITENVAWDHIPFTAEMETVVRKADAVCFGTLSQRCTDSRETIRRIISSSRSDALKVFDINLRQNFYSLSLIKESLAIADILKINDDELKELCRVFGMESCAEDAVCRKLMSDYNIRLLILTAGSRFSSVYMSDGTVSTIMTPKVEVADTVGAGDSFTGTFLAAFLDGNSVPEAHKCAVAAAAEVCSKPGAWV